MMNNQRHDVENITLKMMSMSLMKLLSAIKLLIKV